MRALNRVVMMLLMFFTSWVHAESMPQAKVDFSADADLVLPQMQVVSKVYYTPGKERREYSIRGSQQVSIVRHDKQMVYILMPAAKMYMEVNMKQAQQSVGTVPAEAQLTRKIVGKETINGVPTTKYAITVTDKQANQLQGFMWLSAEDILIKMDAQATQGTQTKPVTVQATLKNVKISKQDTSLFEIPAGYTKMPGQK